MSEDSKQNSVLSFDVGSRSMGYALVTADKRLQRWGIIDLQSNQARDAIDEFIRLVYTDPSYRWMLQCGVDTDLVIETQFGNNGVCKTLSFALMTFFLTMDRERHAAVLSTQAPVYRKVHFMQAASKLRYDMDFYHQRNPRTKDERKLMVVDLVRKLCDEDVQMERIGAQQRQHFETVRFKQQSDLADAYVQALRELQIREEAAAKEQRRLEKKRKRSPSPSPEEPRE